MSWKDAQKWETGWWDTCINTYGEEEKQLLYARKMSLQLYHNKKSPYNINMDGKTVVDIGGGPTSLLLKCTGLIRATVVDPLPIPHWVELRYGEAGIYYDQRPAERFNTDQLYDEAWVYNCLQHTANPKRVVKNALKSAKIVRLFEWVHTRINEGHPHSFKPDLLDKWLGGTGKFETLNGQAQCYGDCYYGVFIGAGLDAGNA